MYKVFVNDKEVRFSDDIEDYHLSNNHSIVCVLDDNIRYRIEYLASFERTTAIYAYCLNLDDSIAKYEDCFEKKIAGGGLVSFNDKFLFIKRNGMWDIPKGHIDNDESIEECAIREVQEETGVTDLTITSPLLITRHTYILNDQHILKETHWFNMQTNQINDLAPQTEEGISEVRWFEKGEFEIIKENAFASISEIVNLI